MNTPTTESSPLAQDRPAIPETPGTSSATPETAWRPLYLLAGLAAMFSVILIALAVGVFLLWPPPTTVEAWFRLFQSNRLLGLLNLDLVMAISAILLVPLYLALYLALRRVSQSFALLATTLGLIGSTLMLAVNPAFTMSGLSDGYTAATTAAQRASYVAAGQAALANWTGTAFDVAYLFSGLAALGFGLLMLRSELFSKAAAYAGIALGALSLVPATAGTVGVWVSLVSLVPSVMWLILTAQHLVQHGISLGLGGEGFVIARPRGRRRLFA